jgi:hypothetical protein
MLRPRRPGRMGSPQSLGWVWSGSPTARLEAGQSISHHVSQDRCRRNLEPPEDLSISPHYLAITPGMRHRSKTELNANVFAILLEVLALELSLIVGDNPVRDPELTHN